MTQVTLEMIKQNNDLIQNYTDSDLQSFAKLGDFSNFNVVSNDTKNNEKVYQSVDYTLSDKKQFKKLMNFNKNIKTSSIEYFIDNFSYSDDLTDNRPHQETNSFYNESDIQNFKNFKKFSFGSSPDTLKYTNKKMFCNIWQLGGSSCGQNTPTGLTKDFHTRQTRF